MKQAWLAAALFLLPLLPATVRADEDGDDEAMAIAYRYGMDRFDRIEELKFTFNVRRGTATVARAWTWNIAADEVSVAARVDGKPWKHTYHPGALSDGDAAANEKADRWFVNDRYWLLFPLQLLNDRGMEITLESNEAFPIPPGNADRLVVEYADNVGYTPGDAYELYFKGDHIVRQWAFRRGGALQPTLVTTWDEHATLGPILVSLRRRTADGSVELWFSDVEARLKGSAARLTPQPGTRP